MILPNEVFQVGYVSKSRGIRGEVDINFSGRVVEPDETDFLVLEMDGILVPFFWEEYRVSNDHTLTVLFEDITDERKAKRLVGAKVFFPRMKSNQNKSANSTMPMQSLIGFRVKNAEGNIVGTIKDIDERNANTLLIIIRENNAELLLPYHKDLVVKTNYEAQELIMDIPQGLLELNQ